MRFWWVPIVVALAAVFVLFVLPPLAIVAEIVVGWLRGGRR